MKRTPEARKAFLEKMIKTHGTPYKAAIAMGITPSAFYDRMNRLGMKPQGYQPLKGEPEGKKAKKEWLLKAITTHNNNISAAARSLGITTSAFRSRMETYGVKNPHDADARRKEFIKAFKESGKSAAKTAEALGITVSAVYERIARYELQTPLQKKLAKEMELV